MHIHSELLRKARRQVEELGGEVVRVEQNHKHPRLVMTRGGQTRWVLIPRSPGDHRTMKNCMADIRRAMRGLPSGTPIEPEQRGKQPEMKMPEAPTIPPIQSLTKPDQAPAANGEHIGPRALPNLADRPVPQHVKNPRVTLSVTSTGNFCVAVQNDLMKYLGLFRASISVDESGHLVMEFDNAIGRKPQAGPARSVYAFSRTKVPFTYSETVVPALSIMDTHLSGNRLIIEQVPEQLRITKAMIRASRPTPTTQPRPAPVAGKHTLTDGADLVAMVNDWLAWAGAEGHEPRAAIEDGRLTIEVSEKVRRKLG
jgi:hypothetical protein